MDIAFKPYNLMGLSLKNRIVMAPMTRSRALEPGLVPSPSMATYYAQRAGAGLIISEGAQPSPEGQGYTSTPGLHSPEQIQGWRRVTDAVHTAGGRIFAQIMHTGRIGHPDNSSESIIPLGPSAVQPKGRIFTAQGMQDFVVPREMTEADIEKAIQDFAAAARNAIEAGFDGVEIHGANGYLVHQFLSVNANQRTDAWGGSPENRARFAVRVAQAVADAIGPERTGIRLSPGASFNDIEDDPDLLRTYLPLVEKLGSLGLAYLHVIEQAGRQLTQHLRDAWPTTFMLNPDTGMNTPTDDRALRLIKDGSTDLLSFGALFLANPDLPKRLALKGPYNTPDPSSYFGGDDHGYLDYPTLDSQPVHETQPATDSQPVQEAHEAHPEVSPASAATTTFTEPATRSSSLRPSGRPAASAGSADSAGPARRAAPLWGRTLVAGAASAVVNIALYGAGFLSGASMIMASPQPALIPWFAPAVASFLPLAILGVIAWLITRKRPAAKRWFAWAGLAFAVISCASLLSAPDAATGISLAAMHLVAGFAWFIALGGGRKSAA